MAQVRALRKAIAAKRKATWRWEFISFVPAAKTHYAERQTKDVHYLQALLKWWTYLDKRAKTYAQNPPHLAMWLCIHSGQRNGRRVGSGEGSWKDHASHNPHYGGLQMGRWFMSHYGHGLLYKVGTADKWLPLVQIWVAERAYETEGYSQAWLFGQWGDTAPPCI
jgi:hypothetical protein